MTAGINKIQLNQLLRFSKLAAMAGGFLMLLLEIRFQHRAALIDDWRPWVPIVFSNTMLYLIPVAGIFWHRGGKLILMVSYCLTMLLGMIGVYFHSEGHLIEHLMEVGSVWIIPPGEGAEITAHYPPILAPLAFVGLGAIGLLFCIESPSTSEIQVRPRSEDKEEEEGEAAQVGARSKLEIEDLLSVE